MKAIILAAGMGTRLRPLTNEIPKALVPVKGESMIERQIRFLREKNVDDIIVVIGYLAHKFTFLQEKYDVKLVFNDKYDVFNNGYSMYLVREHLPGSYVLEGDVYLTNNFLLDKIERACYFSGHKFDFNNEWMLSFDKHDKVTNIKIGSGNGYIMSGISYWDMENGTKVKDKLELAVAERGFEDLFWDDIVRDNLSDFDIYVHKIESDDWFEIDSLTDLTKAESWIKNEIIWSQEKIEPNPYR